MSLESIVEHYGYLAILIGTFLEGETIVVIAGFLANRGYLELEWIIACAFIGTYVGDQLFFYIGKWRGTRILAKRPHWQLRSKRVFELLHRHQTLVILGFRFLYGLRTVTPFLIGMSGVKPLRYLILNGLGAIIWAIAIGVLGYVLGQTVELFLAHVKKYELTILVSIILLAAAYWLYRWRNEQRQIKSKVQDRDSCQD
ncbi:MAG: DedA family protein [Gammaproteobacteria bacterium]|nr:DedA family protein [Gammaproteobacteria bacterium]